MYARRRPPVGAPGYVDALAVQLTIHTHTYGSGQLMIGTLLMLFFGLPSMTRSL
jgi:hypothetical protein